MPVSEVFLNINIYYEINNINGNIVYFILDNGKPIYFASYIDARNYISRKKLYKQKLLNKVLDKQR